MSKVIEIIDSDEELNEQQNTATVITAEVEQSRLHQQQQPQTPQPVVEVKKRRRKSALNPQDADIQFETIYVDEEEEFRSCGTSDTRTANLKTKQAKIADANHKQQCFQTSTTSNATENLDELDDMFEKCMSSEETVYVLHRIAEERVRIKFLLMKLGIDASLLDQQSTLELNFTELKTQIENHLKNL